MRALLDGVLQHARALLAAVGPRRAVTDADRVLAHTREFYVAIDEDGTVLSWNQAAAELFGHRADEALGRPVHDLIVPTASHAAHHAGIAHYLRTGSGRGIGSAVEVDALRRDGSLVPVELTIWAQHTPRGVVFHALGHDLSRRRRRDRALRLLAEHRQGLLLTDTPHGARELLCRTVRDVTQCQGVYLYEPIDPRDPEDGWYLSAQSLTLGEPGTAAVPLERSVLDLLADPASREIRFRLADLSDGPGADAVRATGLQTFVARPLLREATPVGVMLLGWLAADRDTTSGDPELLDLLASEAALVFERLAVQEQLRMAAQTDALTGLLNRREHDARLRRAVERADLDGAPLVLLALDLDRFKGYNDAHGHPAGDALLTEAARCWQEVAPGDGLARTGGDEFALLLPGLDAALGEEVARVLQVATPAPVGLTVGVAQHVPGESAEQLLQRADADLYARKRAR